VAFVKFLSEVSKDSLPEVGGKGANLGEMYNAGLPVPDAFVVTVDAYKTHLEKNKLNVKIFDVLKKTDVNNSTELQKNTKKIRDIIIKAEVPEEIKEAIKEAYKKLSQEYKKKDERVAVRSSATAEDLPGASFAGQQLTILNVVGEENVIDAVKKCWASLFTARATFYRESKNFEHEKVFIAIPVQKQVNSETAGVGFTIHPSTGEKNKILVEGSWGQGESVVSGSVTPDTYVIDKKSGKIIEKHISKKTEMRILDEKGGVNEVSVPKEKQEIQCLSEDELKQIYQFALKLDEHYKAPQDFEWAAEGGKVFLVQTRPVTVLYEKGVEKEKAEIKVEPILKGLAACPGVATGVVKIIKDPSELDKIQKGDVLVTKMTNPDFVPAMKRATAIVTDEGGQTSHAAIVSRELGVVCVVGSREATKKLKDGDVITVHGTEGKVYPGKVDIKVEKKEYKYVKTKTKIYMNLGQPDLADKYKDIKCDGIGLLRAEFMAAELGKHPHLLIEEGGAQKMIDKFAEGIKKVAKAFYPRPIVYRALDFKTNEYAGLEGGDRFEPKEANPMIGWRGASRYITEPDVFELELKAIKKVRDEGLDNVWLMIPFVRTAWELKEINKIVKKVGLERNEKFKLWIMVEVPSSAILIEGFIKDIDGVSIGSNDLTQLVLGVDRDSAILGERWFYELDPAVLWCIKRVVTTCKKHNVTASICGQAPSFYPELTKKLVKWGTTSISVNPDVVGKTRHIVAEVEKELKK